jgi:DNA-directed RNA polymerase specialized sigma subunit
MPQETAVTRELAWRIRQQYEERDARGKRVWTQAQLAAEYGVSETTVFRAINNYGPYGIKPLPEPVAQDALIEQGKASLERMLKDANLIKEREPDKLLEELKGADDGGRDEG